MQYQDAIAEPRDADAAEPETAPEVVARLWQHHSHYQQRLLSRTDVRGMPAHGTVAGRHRKRAAAAPLAALTPRRSESHAALRSKRHLHRRAPGETAKRLFDIVGALCLALLLAPLLVLVVLMLLRDRGPIIYSHRRTGRHGRAFGCLKFRTMVPDAERVLRELLHHDPQLRREWTRDQKLRNDPRVTGIGRFLRRTSLDELPQLWNVLRGDMSLVGPRPVMREEWQRYGRRLDTYLAAKPGVTGLWQVMGRSDTDYRRRVALDSFYVRKRSLRMDAYILLATVKVVLGGRGAC